jgi:hypothetical protein
MRITRIYSGPDGQSHFEQLEIPLTEHAYGFISAFLPATAVAFRENHDDQFIDFHVAPRRQFVINLAGVVELETGLGETHRLGPGDVLLADDLTGKGHISRDISGPRRSIFVPVPEDLDLSTWRKA